jgi:hypothetical protein
VRVRLLLSAAALVTASLTAPPAQAATWVDGVREANEQYKSVAKAEAAGFGEFADADGITCIEHHHEGGMGVHYVHGKRVGDAVIKARKPEALVYAPAANGKLKLAAVEYIVFKSAWRAEHPTGKPKLKGEKFTLVPAGNRYGIPAFYALHVWAWMDNPAGLFAGYNPDVVCP